MRFVYILLWFISVPALALQAGVVHLTAGDHLYCSGTIVRTENGKCHLLTAAHCADMTSNWRVSSHGTGDWANWLAGPAKGALNQTLAVEHIDRDRDLAQLKWPQALNNFCTQLEPFAMRTAFDLTTSRESVALFGVLGKQVETQTIDDGPWPQHAQPSERKVYSFGGIDDLQIENIRGTAGFSGGPVIDFTGKLLGIYKKFIPRDDVILVATTHQILEFINRLNPPRTIKYCPQTVGRYHNGGGNSHVNGGMSAGASRLADALGLDGEALRHWVTFVEPTEGILNPHNCRSVILGKGDARIDGPEDYERLLKAPGKWIERPVDDFPEKMIQRGILDRFVGTYVSKNFSKTNNYLIKNGYVELAQSNLRTRARVRITITKQSSTEYQILMEQDQAQSYSYIHPQAGLQMQASKTQLAAKLRPDGNAVDMVQDGLQSYLCVNDNYLKLICEGPGLQFSISKASLKDSSLKLRYTRGMQARLRDNSVFKFFVHTIDDMQKVR